MDLKLWNKKDLYKKSFSMIIAGSRRSGKSTLIKDLYQKIPPDYITIVFSNSMNNDFYAEFVKGGLLYSEYSPMRLLKFMQIIDQRKLKALVIFDDCISGAMSYKSKEYEPITQLFSRGRHIGLGVSVIFATQTITCINTDWRENIDYMVIFKQKTSQKRDIIIKSFLDGTIDEDEVGITSEEFFKKLFSQYLVDHYCIIVDYMVDSNEAEDILYKYRASLTPLSTTPSSTTVYDL